MPLLKGGAVDRGSGCIAVDVLGISFMLMFVYCSQLMCLCDLYSVHQLVEHVVPIALHLAKNRVSEVRVSAHDLVSIVYCLFCCCLLLRVVVDGFLMELVFSDLCVCMYTYIQDTYAYMCACVCVHHGWVCIVCVCVCSCKFMYYSNPNTRIHPSNLS